MEIYDPDRPFAPLDSGAVPIEKKEFFFEDYVDPFKEYQKRPQVIAGRRGSGKTAFLHSAYFTEPDSIVVEVRKDQTLNQVILTLSEVPEGAQYAEAVEQIWDTIIMTVVLNQAIEQISGLKISKDYLAKIGANKNTTAESVAWALVNTLIESSPSKSVSTLARFVSKIHSLNYSDARQELIETLQRENKKVVILFDSLESEGYILTNTETRSAIRGWLKWLGNTATSHEPIEARYCIPGEYYSDFLAISSNPLKDFASQVKLRWKPRDLLIVAARRWENYKSAFRDPKSLDSSTSEIDTPENALLALSELLPTKILVNQTGQSEECSLYVLRHTQMLPRQFLIILNRVTQEFGIDESASINDIISAVTESAAIITSEIYSAFQHQYPFARNYVEELVSELPTVFKYGELYSRLNRGRFKGESGLDVHEATKMLADIGCIGKVIGRNGRYLDAQFAYNSETELRMRSENKLCVHPLFSILYKTQNRENDIAIMPRS